jgi:hypothetical protein
MAHTLMNIGFPRVMSVPRAAVAASLRASLARVGSRLWRECEIIGEQRARQHMMGLARQYDSTSPELAREIRQTWR